MKVRKHVMPDGDAAYEWLEWTEDEWDRHVALGSDSRDALEAEADVVETVDHTDNPGPPPNAVGGNP